MRCYHRTSLDYEMAFRPVKALIEIDLGKTEKAIDEIKRCKDILAAGEDWRGLHGIFSLASAVAEGALGNQRAAEVQFVESIDVFKRFHLPWHQAESQHRWGQMLLGVGKYERAAEKFDAALELYQVHGAGARWAGLVLADKILCRPSRVPSLVGSKPSESIKTWSRLLNRRHHSFAKASFGESPSREVSFA